MVCIFLKSPTLFMSQLLTEYESLWVSEKQVADDLISDFQEGLSSEPFQCILSSKGSEKKR